MGTLIETIEASQKRPALIQDCVGLIEEQVRSQSGLSGVAIKGAFAVVKKIRPGIIREAVTNLLDAFLERMEPYYQAAAAEGQPDLVRYIASHRSEVANALLGVTDERAKRANNKTLVKAYNKLRPMGAKQVESALPKVAVIVNRYAPVG